MLWCGASREQKISNRSIFSDVARGERDTQTQLRDENIMHQRAHNGHIKQDRNGSKISVFWSFYGAFSVASKGIEKGILNRNWCIYARFSVNKVAFWWEFTVFKTQKTLIFRPALATALRKTQKKTPSSDCWWCLRCPECVSELRACQMSWTAYWDCLVLKPKTKHESTLDLPELIRQKDPFLLTFCGHWPSSLFNRKNRTNFPCLHFIDLPFRITKPLLSL